MENWKDVPGYEGLYRVSDQGRVKSLSKVIVRNHTNGNYLSKEKILRPALVQGYPMVALSKNGKAKSIRVHILVMLAFVGPAPEGCEVLHKNGDRTDARLTELRYGTRRENMADARLHKSMAGVRNGNAKLTSEMILDITSAYAELEEKLAKKHSVCVGTIRNLKMNRTYAIEGTRK